MKKLSYLLLLSFLLAFGLTACSTPSEDVAVEPALASANNLIAEGRLTPVNSMELSFSIPGQVAEVLVEDGESVEKGQVLVRLSDSPEARLALARAQQEELAAQHAINELRESADLNMAQAKLAVIAAQNQLDEAQDVFESDASDENQALVDQALVQIEMAEDTQMKLEDGDGIDPDQLAAAEARLSSAQAAISSAQAALDSLELTANMTGNIVDLTLQEGQQVSAGQPVITIANFTSWVVETQNLTEIELVDVEVGQKAEVIFDAMPDTILSGEVILINQRYAEARGDITYTAKILLDEVDPGLRWGMTAAVKFLP